ncbi:hypothetical protein MPTK1_3g02450 [Marchantia polymorpha subsp. ruderalis]|uniref:Translation elongation factor EF1B beta/delta subunit guanine nucleotide exchange domain-containing protein n=2 Tax=Marchantia polymorpha TaxID=3197 RepID=A0AAF6AWP9_MARPO|nr:hypothetical protein MARPO_0007s0234 [Marchantia polymorpha]BBN04183.1 hypothetical protein Mp_3g02450 [Marchantia polymorpha subsp. ruderalis]|eukprot:PTQ47870.1 hypothetical protein MARPO_0007s0234 [Marchantia polymorpha]
MATALYAMAINFDVTTDSGLAHLDNYLLTRSFITGHRPSRDDVTVFSAIAPPPRADGRFLNLSRWYAHIDSIVRATFPGAAQGVTFGRAGAGAALPPPVDVGPAIRTFPDAALENGDDSPRDSFGEFEQSRDSDDVEALAALAAAVGAGEAQAGDATPLASRGRSSILLEVKPWDDETDMEALERAVRAVELPGLQWGASRLEPVAFRINKLQIMMTIDDDLVSPDFVIEHHLTAEPANEHIQSCDIVACNKI